MDFLLLILQKQREKFTQQPFSEPNKDLGNDRINPIPPHAITAHTEEAESHRANQHSNVMSVPEAQTGMQKHSVDVRTPEPELCLLRRQTLV